jgi:hypothetical protein
LDTEIDKAATHLLTSLRLGENDLDPKSQKGKLLRADILVGRHIEYAYDKVKQVPNAENEFKLAVYLRVWSEIASRLFLVK